MSDFIVQSVLVIMIATTSITALIMVLAISGAIGGVCVTTVLPVATIIIILGTFIIALI